MIKNTYFAHELLQNKFSIVSAMQNCVEKRP